VVLCWVVWCGVMHMLPAQASCQTCHLCVTMRHCKGTCGTHHQHCGPLLLQGMGLPRTRQPLQRMGCLMHRPSSIRC
jgi:hypothetical protein